VTWSAGGGAVLVVVVTSCADASEGKASMATKADPASINEMRRLPITAGIVPCGKANRADGYGTSLARSARTGIGKRSAVTTASHAVWIRICAASGPVASPRVISTRW
jgi:hypothetical protein